MPPSWVLMVLAKVCTDSWYDMFHCIASSRLIPDSGRSASTAITLGLTTSLLPVRYLT